MPMTLRVKLVKIRAKVVRHDRCVSLQMAEVAVPRDLFRDVLRLIDGLQRPFLAAGWTEEERRSDGGRSMSG